MAIKLENPYYTGNDLRKQHADAVIAAFTSRPNSREITQAMIVSAVRGVTPGADEATIIQAYQDAQHIDEKLPNLPELE